MLFPIFIPPFFPPFLPPSFPPSLLLFFLSSQMYMQKCFPCFVSRDWFLCSYPSANVYLAQSELKLKSPNTQD